MYTTEEGGIIPQDAAKHHRELSQELFDRCLKEANIMESKIDIIAFSKGPGLAPCLLAGKEFSINLAKKLNLPLVGVNHLAAHLEIGKLFAPVKDPVYLFVSGANTQIIALEGGKFRIFGETLSIGLGNALDKFGREASLGFPGGPKIEQLAKNGKYIKLPYSVKGIDVDFSGIVTEATRQLNKGVKLEDLCFSLQETCFAMLTEVTERALAHTGKNEVLLIGGVAANKRFSEMLSVMCKERDAKSYAVPLKYAGDNAAMIAYLGIKMFKAKQYESLDKIDINPRWRIDEFNVPWT